MKPLNRKNYGSIPHLSNSKLGSGDHFVNHGQEKILTVKKRDRHDEVFAFEKYDGSNVGIAKKDGQIFALTRSGYTAESSSYKQHHLFSDYVHEYEYLFDAILDEGERLCGEWLAQAHGLKYDINTYPILFFDWFDANNKRKPYNELVKTKLPLVRLLHRGDAVSVEDLLPKLITGTDEIQSLEMPEGIVYRVERKGKVDFLAKWVRQDFDPGKFCIGVDEKDLIWNIRQ
ncbi:MAG: hypothetical protein CMM93_08560 [Rickettsiales bacterium]|nr:hypothetical protein [Rickettsiales bacterium]